MSETIKLTQLSITCAIMSFREESAIISLHNGKNKIKNPSEEIPATRNHESTRRRMIQHFFTTTEK